ncbi:unnamed protein product [Polarella glacialis]|uniref:Uncharacterized protein n=1 Tax=Polarella glacialis TaxID=89957 RepID=A0A813LKC1_POLGL|nr:unnamed protein product [Polarella glacialis]
MVTARKRKKHIQVERTTDALVTTDDGSLDEVRKTLIQVRQQYDAVHHEAEQKEARLRRVREEIRTADLLHASKGDDTHKLEENWGSLKLQYQDTLKRNKETQTARKVYEHMLARIQKEQAILKQKLLRMEEHMDRKRREVHQKRVQSERARCDRTEASRTLEALSEDAELEARACRTAREVIDDELYKRKEGNCRRASFESKRHSVALQAANEAFNASAGRLRKLYAIEKLSGNSLQRITFEQVERSQNTEDGFQKIRDVTGLADVMDIVHKFLNRDVEHEQLQGSVKEAEVRLEALRQAYDAFKQKTEGITFDQANRKAGGLYKEIEKSEQDLNEVMEEHEASRVRLQKNTLQSEHVKRWAGRVGQLLAHFEEPAKVETPQDLPIFFKKMEVAVEKFVNQVTQQINDGRINRKALSDMAIKEYKEQSRMISNHEFLRSNCRVQVATDADKSVGAGRPNSRQGPGGTNADEDPGTSFAEDRDRCKKDSDDLASKVQAEQLKKRPKGS